MTTRADLIIVGGGLAGSAAAWAASERGLDVVLLEAYGPGHRNGSSHGSARIFRRAYPDALYVRMTGQAGELWQRLSDESGEELIRVTGGLDIGDPEVVRPMAALLAEHGVATELLGPDEAAQRWPGILFPAGPVLFQPHAGALDPQTAMDAMIRLASTRGARVLYDTPVERLTVTGGGAAAHTAGGTFTAPAVVVAAGAWTAPLLAGLVTLPALRVTQQQVFHFAPARDAAPLPVAMFHDPGELFYCLPGGRDGGVPGAYKIGAHYDGTPFTTADSRDFAIDPASRDRVRSLVERRFPGLRPEPFNEASCLYTWTGNEDFVLDRRGPLIVASACSGHGAKFAPLLGQIIAGLAAGAPPPDPRFTLAAHLAT